MLQLETQSNYEPKRYEYMHDILSSQKAILGVEGVVEISLIDIVCLKKQLHIFCSLTT